jgi:hypothetical protein
MMAMNALILIGCVIGLGVLVGIVGVVLVLRYLSYRETLAMIEKGIAPPPKVRGGKDTLRWGIILTALGAALCIGLYPLGYAVPNPYPFSLGPWMLLGLLPLFFGLALILIYVLTKKEKDEGMKEKDEG